MTFSKTRICRWRHLVRPTQTRSCMNSHLFPSGLRNRHCHNSVFIFHLHLHASLLSIEQCDAIMTQIRGAQKVVTESPNGHLNGYAHANGVAHQTNERTDYSRWRLLDEQGRHTWHYLETDEQIKEWPQSIADKHHLGLDTVRNSHYLKSTLTV